MSPDSTFHRGRACDSLLRLWNEYVENCHRCSPITTTLTVGEIKANTRELLLDTFYAFYRKDVDAVVKALTELGIIVATGDTISVRRALAFFIDNLNKEVKQKEAVAVRHYTFTRDYCMH